MPRRERPRKPEQDRADAEWHAGAASIGVFRRAFESDRFGTVGPFARHCVVFHRRATWIAAGGPPFVADSTRLTMWNPQQTYERRLIDPGGDCGGWLALPDPVVREIVGRYDPAASESPVRVLRHTSAPAPPALYLAHWRLQQYLRRHAAPDLLLVEEAAVDLVSRAIAGAYERAPVPSHAGTRAARQHRELVERARAHLNIAFMENERLETIAQAAGASIFHLCRVFRRGTGMTLQAYRHQLRLRHALEHLDGARDLLTLALALGYSSHSHFTAAFRRHYGVAPSKCRQAFWDERRPPGDRRTPERAGSPAAVTNHA